MRSATAAQASRVCSGAIKRGDPNSSWMTLQSGRVAGCAAKRPQPCGPAASACEAPPFALRDLIRSVAASAFYGPSAPSLHPLKGTQRFNLDPNGWLSLPDNRLRNTALRANMRASQSCVGDVSRTEARKGDRRRGVVDIINLEIRTELAVQRTTKMGTTSNVIAT
jgi:hypothetical protein